MFAGAVPRMEARAELAAEVALAATREAARAVAREEVGAEEREVARGEGAGAATMGIAHHHRRLLR